MFRKGHSLPYTRTFGKCKVSLFDFRLIISFLRTNNSQMGFYIEPQGVNRSYTLDLSSTLHYVMHCATRSFYAAEIEL
jgi:hypothetical protein